MEGGGSKVEGKTNRFSFYRPPSSFDLKFMNTFKILLGLKFRLILNSVKSLQKRSRFEFFILIFFFLFAAWGLFAFFYQSFRFFKGQEPFGPILIDETFYLFNFALFTMLFISSAVASYSSLFRSKEVAFLLTKPAGWTEIYFIKLLESLWFSSWSFLFVAAPFMAAYGLVKNAGLFPFPFLCLAFYIPFVALAGMLGSLTSVLVVWLLPSRKRRYLALMLAVAGITAYFAHVQPEAIKEQGSIAGIMSGYLPHVTFAKNPLLPSYWTTRGVLALSTLETKELLDWRDGLFYALLMLSNTLFFLLPSYWAGSKLFAITFLKAQDHAENRSLRRAKNQRTWFEKFLDALPWPSKPALAFLEKDIKTFSRDPAEWSQLIIFFGLLLFYFANLKNLQFHVLKEFWKNLVFILNTIGTYIVLSSFSMRFVFPMLSLEGSRSWILGLAPMRFSSLLLEKFLLGTVISGILTMPLIFLSGWMLEIELSRILFVTCLGFFVCVALTGLSVGFGAKFPNFKSTNPAEIISGFGGSMLLVFHLSYLALIGLYLLRAHGNSQPIIAVFVAGLSILTAMVPMKAGINALRKMEF